MQASRRLGLVLGLVLFGCGRALFASEADELRAKANALRAQAAALAEKGNKEEAQRLEQEVLKLLKAAEQAQGNASQSGKSGLPKEATHLQARLKELRAAERKAKEVNASQQELEALRAQIASAELELQAIVAKHGGEAQESGKLEFREALHPKSLLLKQLRDVERRLVEAKAPEQQLDAVRAKIEALEQELQATGAKQGAKGDVPDEFRPHVEKLEAAMRRIQHLRVAAENLKLAEVPELARQVVEQAEALEREVQQAKAQLAAEMQKYQSAQQGAEAAQKKPDVVQELRAEVERLRAELQELRQRVEKR